MTLSIVSRRAPISKSALLQCLADIGSTYIVNFATSGDPNRPVTTTAAGNVLPQWPAFEGPNSQLMLLGDVIARAALANRASMELFDDVWTQKLGHPPA